MNGKASLFERVLALFVLGMLLLNAPFLVIFDKNTLVLGVPVLYAYLFAVWGGLIVGVALVTHFHGGQEPLAPQNGIVASGGDPVGDSRVGLGGRDGRTTTSETESG
ncbi:MAG: hypothetical protein R3D67_20070 [Hyphomicrobiaceae bacterium]